MTNKAELPKAKCTSVYVYVPAAAERSVHQVKLHIGEGITQHARGLLHKRDLLLMRPSMSAVGVETCSKTRSTLATDSWHVHCKRSA